MRLLFLSSELPHPADSGGTIKTASILGYQKGRHHVDLLCFRRRPLTDEQARWCQATGGVETVPLNRGRTPLGLLGSYLRSIPLSIERNRSRRMADLVSGRLSDGGYGAVFMDGWLMAQYLPPGFAGLALLHEHNAEHVMWRRQAQRERNPLVKALIRLEYRRVRRYEAAILPRFDIVFAVSEADRQALIELGADPERLRVLPNLPEPSLLERPALSFAATEPVILYFGTLSWPPNVEGIEYFLRSVFPGPRGHSFREPHFVAEGGRIMHGSTASIVRALAVVAAFATSGQVDGGTIIPIDQDRWTQTAVWSECELFTTDSDAAKGFSPFNSLVQTVQQCDDIFGWATASQQSEIGASSMTAFGSATSEGESPTLIQTVAASVFEVAFELPAAINFAVDGVISVDGAPGLVTALIRLIGPGDQMIFEHTLVATGGPDSQVIEEAGVLEPGEYTLYAYADFSWANPIDVIPLGEAFFDFAFVIAVPCPADLDGDGSVGASDLLLLLVSWGPCRGCSADFDGNGTVGASDLLTLLANWGPCPYRSTEGSPHTLRDARTRVLANRR